MHRYTGKLLFQYRIEGADSVYRQCIISYRLVRARDEQSAVKKLRRIGRNEELNYLNTDGDKVHLEFVGIMDFIDLLDAEDGNEVFYEAPIMKLPMERRSKIVRTDLD